MPDQIQFKPFSINVANGDQGPVESLLSGIGGSSQSAFMAFNQNPFALRPWVDMTPAQATLQAALMEAGMATNADLTGLMPQAQSYVSVNGKNFRVNAGTLLKDEWKYYDDVVLKVAQERLVGVADLMSRGLVLNVPNALGTTVLEYEKVSGVEGATMSMDAVTRGRRDAPVFTIHYLPLPIIHDDFSLTIRHLMASRKRGTPIDTLRLELGTRNVAEYVENMLFNGPGSSTYVYGGGTIYGYTNQSGRLTYTTMAGWGDSGITGEEVLKDVLNMKQLLIASRHYGPYMIYIPTEYETVLDDEFKANSDKSVRQRIMEIGGIEGIKVADKLADDNVVMVELKAETVRMVVGFQPMVVEWQTMGGMQFEYKVMTIMVPQIRTDSEGHCGILHATTS
jgi:hypothetical protein